MAFLKKKNNAKSILATNVLVGDSSIEVADASSFPSTTDFIITIWDKNSYSDPSDDPSMEVLKVTGIVGNVFSVTRAQESTSAKDHNLGNAVEHLFTVGQLEEIEQFFDNFLSKTNTTSYTPSAMYHPATKEYVDSQLQGENHWDLNSGGVLVTYIPNTSVNLGSGYITASNLHTTEWDYAHLWALGADARYQKLDLSNIPETPTTDGFAYNGTDTLELWKAGSLVQSWTVTDDALGKAWTPVNTTEYIASDGTGAFNITTATGFSICFWVKPANAGTSTMLIVKDPFSGTSSRFLYFSRAANKTLLLVLSTSNGGSILTPSYPTSTGTIEDDTWYFVCVTFSQANGGKIYINGSVDGTGVHNGNSITPNNGIPFIFGGRHTGTQVSCGTIDEPLVFNRELSSAEITTLYNSGAGKYGNIGSAPWNSGLQIGYHLDEGSGTAIADFSGNGNDGDIENNANPTWVDGKVPAS